jgi:phosphatidylglycerophosphate synthase
MAKALNSKKLHAAEDEEDYLISGTRRAATPLIRAFKAIRWTPNTVTILGGLLWLAAFTLIALNIGMSWNIVAFALYLLSRLTNQTSDTGYFLDTMLDYLRDTILYLLAFYMAYTHTGNVWVIWLYATSMGMWFINQKTDVERKFLSIKKNTRTNLREEIGKTHLTKVAMKLYNSFDQWGINWATMLLLALSYYTFIKYVFAYLLVSKFVRNAFSVYATVKMLKH